MCACTEAKLGSDPFVHAADGACDCIGSDISKTL